MTRRILDWLILAFLFLLPWQMRYIFAPGQLGGKYWEYTTQSLYATELLGWIIIILFGIELLRDRAVWHRIRAAVRLPAGKKFFATTFAIVILTAIAIARSADPSLSYYYIFHLLEAVCLFLVLVETAISARAVWVAFWLGGVGQGILGIWQFATQHIGANKWLGLAAHTPSNIGDFVVELGNERWLRAYGSFGSPTMLGAYLALALIVGLMLYQIVSPKQKILVTLGQSTIVLGLIVTFARGAWLAAVMGIAVLFIVILSEAKNLHFKSQSFSPIGNILKQLFFYTLLAIAAIIILRPLFTARVAADGRLESRSLTERSTQYSQAWQLFQQAPLLGVDPGQYTVKLYEQVHELRLVQPVHNSYLLILTELGSILFIILGFAGGFIVWKIIRANPMSLPFITTLLILGCFEHFWWTLFTGVILWGIIIGLATKKLFCQ